MGLNRDTGNVGRGGQVVWNCYSEVAAGQNSGQQYTTPLMEICGWITALPIFNTKHFSTETVNCQVAAQLLSESSAACSLIMSFSSVTRKYSLASSANNLIFIPSFSNTCRSPFINIKNINGPILLPCMTPLSNSETSDNDRSTSVCCERPQKVF